MLSPEHAATFGGAGWSKDDVRRAVHEAAVRPARELVRGEVPPATRASDPDAPIHKLSRPEDAVIVVAGGEAGRFTAVLGPWAGVTSMVTKEVRWST